MDDKQLSHSQGELAFQMEYDGPKGFKRLYICPMCKQRTGIEQRSGGKIPYCFGIGRRVEFLTKVRYKAAVTSNGTAPTAPTSPTLPRLIDNLGFWRMKSEAGEDVGQHLVDLREQRDGHEALHLAWPKGAK